MHSSNHSAAGVGTLRFAQLRRAVECGTGQHNQSRGVQTGGMTNTSVQIIAAECVSGGVLIEFSDGQVALFPPALLWKLVPGFNVEVLREGEEGCRDE